MRDWKCPALCYTTGMWARIAFGAVGLFVARAGASFFSRAWWLLRQLWHEVMGAMFLVLAVGGASAAIREWNTGADLLRLALAASFTLMMGWFGVTSFGRARRVKRQGAPQR